MSAITIVKTIPNMGKYSISGKVEFHHQRGKQFAPNQRILIKDLNKKKKIIDSPTEIKNILSHISNLDFLC